ncbi:hypothetical protein BUALT_Bualt03G0036300 [Buddleja alternifolia]|uniref:Uncharacterized protein n=1 Tax=Buddleja alternifolia TaxID=168488 RepID=A0AAV6Y1P8_9LAMI|nr:hypothetical protein BUALT_Bualt03G0036300 [Buddleja alternifolia]
MAPMPPFLLLFPLLLLYCTLSCSLSVSNYKTLLSLSHSLTSRVATLRTDRGDLEGAERARTLAHNLEREMGLGFYKVAWNVGRDYIQNYASWRDSTDDEMSSIESSVGDVSDLNELLGALCELNHIHSDEERLAWLSQNYMNALGASKSLFSRLLKVFRRPGTLREALETLQKEVVEGDLLRDCLELGADDLKSLIQVVKDIALQFSSASPKTDL